MFNFSELSFRMIWEQTLSHDQCATQLYLLHILLKTTKSKIQIYHVCYALLSRSTYLAFNSIKTHSDISRDSIRKFIFPYVHIATLL